mgnify:CR=1 FL=1
MDGFGCKRQAMDVEGKYWLGFEEEYTKMKKRHLTEVLGLAVDEMDELKKK